MGAKSNGLGKTQFGWLKVLPFIYFFVGFYVHTTLAISGEVPTCKSVHLWLVGCWSFTSWQHLSSYQDGFRLVAVHTHGNLIVLPHWKTGLPEPLPDIPLSQIILTLSPVLIMASAWLGTDKYQTFKVICYMYFWMYLMIKLRKTHRAG